jgi:zinc protease
MTLIVKPDRRAPTAAHMVWLRVGAMDEVDGMSGVAHVLEHMLFKGTQKLAPGEFSRRVAAMGGRENAFTGRDYTGYYQQIPSERLEEVMALEADRFANNRWPDDEFKRELEVVKEERRLRIEDSPRAMLYEVISGATFLASPYRRPISGWMGDLESMTPQDAREFFQRWYVPANAVVVVAGDVDPQQVLRLAQKTYGSIPARPVPARKPRMEPAQAGARRVEYKAPAEQSYVALSFKVPQVSAFDASPRPTTHWPSRCWPPCSMATAAPGWTARSPRARTAWPTARAPATACGAAARSCSRWTACRRRARRPSRSRRPCAPKWRGWPVTASPTRNCSA